MQPIFSRNSDYRKIAFMNWRTDNGGNVRDLLNMAEGYMDSAILLAQACLEDNEDKKADIIIFPILSNANHGIELYLKALTWMLNQLLKSDRKIEGSHNIRQILQTLQSKVKLYQGAAKLREFNVHIHNLIDYIDELFAKIKATAKDDKMDFSRYPFTNKYDNHFYVDEIGTVEIDLENFTTRFQEIKINLESFADYLYYQELYHDQ